MKYASGHDALKSLVGFVESQLKTSYWNELSPLGGALCSREDERWKKKRDARPYLLFKIQSDSASTLIRLPSARDLIVAAELVSTQVKELAPVEDTEGLLVRAFTRIAAERDALKELGFWCAALDVQTEQARESEQAVSYFDPHRLALVYFWPN